MTRRDDDIDVGFRTVATSVVWSLIAIVLAVAVTVLAAVTMITAHRRAQEFASSPAAPFAASAKPHAPILRGGAAGEPTLVVDEVQP